MSRNAVKLLRNVVSNSLFSDPSPAYKLPSMCSPGICVFQKHNNKIVSNLASSKLRRALTLHLGYAVCLRDPNMPPRHQFTRVWWHVLSCHLSLLRTPAGPRRSCACLNEVHTRVFFHCAKTEPPLHSYPLIMQSIICLKTMFAIP